MSDKSHEIVVALDLNTLSLLNGTDPPNTAVKYDPAKEKESLEILGHMTDPLVKFRYPEDALRGAHRDTAEFVKDDFLDFEKSAFIIVGDFRKEMREFIDALKQKNEKQDDIEVLCFAAFSEGKRIRHIVTVDVKFINRLSSIHGSLKNDKKMLDWALAQRPDFLEIQPCLPSELLDEIQKGLA